MPRITDPNLYLGLGTALQIMGVQAAAIVLLVILLKLYSHFEDI